MEMHKDIAIDSKYKLSMQDDYIQYFSKALEFTNQYYKEDLNRISSTKFSEITPEIFFREYCWAICTSGFNAKIVSKFYPKLLLTLDPLIRFINNSEKINSIDVGISALSVFNNSKKIKAMIDCAFILNDGINNFGWSIYKDLKLNSPEKLQELPFIGPITCFHLARNIGLLDYVKPDLHLERAAKHWNFNNSLEMCKAIKDKYDLPLGIIDLCFWYAFSTFGSK